jgi:hypothetical protein
MNHPPPGYITEQSPVVINNTADVGLVPDELGHRVFVRGQMDGNTIVPVGQVGDPILVERHGTLRCPTD